MRGAWPRVLHAPHHVPTSFFAGAEGGSELKAVLLELAALKSGQEALKSGQEALKMELKLIAHASTHAVTERAQQLISSGAMFYVTNGETGQPLFCGFFVSESVALTISHDPMFDNMPPTLCVYGVSSSSPPRKLAFDVVSTDKILDFTVLRLRGDPSSAFFSLQAHADVVGGLDVGLVTMGIGSAQELGAATPAVSVQRVSITSVEAAHFTYDGAATWAGDSGAGLLFDEGYVVGMHLEVIDAKPALKGKRLRGGGSGSPTARLAALELDVDRASDAASSHGKICRALLLSHPSVLTATESARVFGAAGGGSGGAGVKGSG